MEPADPRQEQLARWERGASGWRKHADRVQKDAIPVSAWMIEQLALQPGQRVLELAAGPGDTGFLAAELVAPGGSLICSDATEAMLEIARERARSLGIENVEFRRLELEWIDLEAASVDAVLCRWGYMFVPDPEAALRETRRVLRPLGRLAAAVWDRAECNPRGTVISAALVKLGHVEPPDPGPPGTFALADQGRIAELLDAAGFAEVAVEALDIEQRYEDLEALLVECREMSPSVEDVYERLDADGRAEFERTVASLVAPYTGDDGAVRLPARSLVVAAGA